MFLETDNTKTPHTWKYLEVQEVQFTHSILVSLEREEKLERSEPLGMGGKF